MHAQFRFDCRCTLACQLCLMECDSTISDKRVNIRAKIEPTSYSTYVHRGRRACDHKQRWPDHKQRSAMEATGTKATISSALIPREGTIPQGTIPLAFPREPEDCCVKER